MGKYIIDIPKTVGVGEVGSVHYTFFDGIQVQTIVLKGDDLEELNSDYINEHFGELQDTAYQKGFEDGKKATWEATRKIAEMWETIDNDELLGIFGLTAKIGESTIGTLFKKQTASEAIEKLKAYEEKQKADEKIEVGDEVEWDNDFTGDRFIVTRIYQPYGKKEQCDGIDDDGDVYRAVLIESLVKTGRHFDIQSILEAMKHD